MAGQPWGGGGAGTRACTRGAPPPPQGWPAMGGWVLDIALVLDIGYWILVLDIGYWVLDIGYWVLDIAFTATIAPRINYITARITVTALIMLLNITDEFYFK